MVAQITLYKYYLDNIIVSQMFAQKSTSSKALLNLFCMFFF